MQANVGRGGPGGGGPGGPPPGGPGGPPTLTLPPGGGPTFRVYRFAASHPGLAGKDLTPGKTIEEMEKKEPEKKEPQAKGPQTKEPEKK